MESAAHPCLDSLQKQVCMTFLNQVVPNRCDPVKCVTCCGRNRVRDVKRNDWERPASDWQDWPH